LSFRVRASTSKITSHLFDPLSDGFRLYLDFVEHRASFLGKSLQLEPNRGGGQ
jgi:hypothetical protein